MEILDVTFLTEGAKMPQQASMEKKTKPWMGWEWMLQVIYHSNYYNIVSYLNKMRTLITFSCSRIIENATSKTTWPLCVMSLKNFYAKLCSMIICKTMWIHFRDILLHFWIRLFHSAKNSYLRLLAVCLDNIAFPSQ